MKFLSSLILILLLVWSWKEVNAPAAVNLSTHISLQENIQTIIKEKIKELAPTATDITFQKIWTRSVSDNRVEAFFEYTFTTLGASEAAVKTHLRGKAQLTRTSAPTVPADESAWTFDRLEINGQEIEFEDDTIIQPGTSDKEPVELPTPAKGTPRQAPHKE